MAVARRRQPGPVSAEGIYEMVKRRGKQAGVMSARTGSGIISAAHGWTAAGLRGT